MSDNTTLEINQDIKDAILYMERALNALKKGLHMEDQPAEVEAPAAKVREGLKTEQSDPFEKAAPSLEEIRKIFAKIMLDEKVDGKGIIKSALDKFKAAKISEVNPADYLGITQFAIHGYEDLLEKMDKVNADEKLRDMAAWIIPF